MNSDPSCQLSLPARGKLFRRRLLRWYDRHKRDLPWRGQRDPYRIWLSEIMLQQTRVAAVTDYYHRFLERFPSVHDLAAAPLPSVLAAWSGLGYYRRARMLHEAARQIVNERAGAFPKSAEEWSTLPGIGRYTAAALASIAFVEPIAVVDGNVDRVLQRLRGKRITREAAWQLAQTLLSRSRPGDFNQAMMELGATICLPGEPKCLACPVAALCATQGSLPQDGKPARKKKEVYYRLSRRNGSVYLVQRPPDATLMPDMWELPEMALRDGGSSSAVEKGFTLRHSITVTDYTVRVLPGRVPAVVNGSWVACSRLLDLPLTGLTRKILRAARII